MGRLNRKPDTDLLQFVNSPKFEPTRPIESFGPATARSACTRSSARAGTSTPSSSRRASTAGAGRTEAYSRFLRTRRVDFVIVYDSYDKRYNTNEHALLDQLSVDGLRRHEQRVGAAPLEQATTSRFTRCAVIAEDG